MKIGVIIVEDVQEIREWVCSVIRSDESLECLAVFADAESCIQAYDQYSPEVVIMDINLPGMSGIDCIKRIKPHKPEVQMIVFTVFEDDDHVFDALCSGASGYILKNTTAHQMIEAVHDVSKGGSPMSSSIARKVISSFQRSNPPQDEYNKLSGRERELLDLLARGYRYKEIATKLFISVETVRTHIRNIYDKLQVQSRTEALNKIFPRG
jgi:DNA-binding NarL/FixJ family response regulator